MDSKKLLHFALFFFFFWSHYAQEFKNISVQDGLSGHQAYSVVQDRNGFIWVSTKSGIDRYNGESISNYNLLEQKETFISQQVRLVTDDQKIVWAYTRSGNIYRFNDERNSFELIISLSERIKSPCNVSNLAVNDVFWISTDIGLYSYNQKNQKLKKVSDFGDDPIQMASPFKDNAIFVALKDRLVLYDEIGGITKTLLRQLSKANYNWIRSIFFDKAYNEVWIGTREGEVHIYGFETQKILRLREKIPQLPTVPVNTILLYKDAIFIGSDGGGVLKVDRRNKKLLQNFKEDEDRPNSLRGNGVQDMLVSTSGKLLVTTFTGSLNILDDNYTPFHILRHEVNNPNSLRNNVVNSILEDMDKDLWFATNNGVSCWQRSKNKWIHYLDGQSGQPNVFLSLFQYDTNRIMAGSYSKGLFIIDKGKGVVNNILPGLYNPNNTDATDYVVEIFEDSNKKIWTGGTFKDLAIYNPKNERYDYLPIRGVTNIQPKDKDHIFIATQSGLYVVNQLNYHYYKEDFGGKLNESLFINSLFFDKGDVTLWIATSGAGIIKWDINGERIERIDEKSGMPSNHVYAILPDSENNIWASTENGLVKYGAQKERLESFSLKNGLSDESFYKNSKLRDSSGKLYFGSYEGVTYF
ncbi:MAG: two-component regulator propeller domain-containing protein, partial [Bacteroidota bacterium]